MAKRTIPNFFIAGAPKAGTDALYYDLRGHPEIYMSPLKEPNYFAGEVRVENFAPALRPRMLAAEQSTRDYLAGDRTELRFGGFVTEWDNYLQLFAGATDEKAIGEGSVCYLWSPTAASAIASRTPKARVIIVLMDPAERAFHQYLKSLSDGTVRHSFGTHLDHAFADKGDEFGVYHPFLSFGNYAVQVRRYFAAFPAGQLSITLYEDMRANHAEWFSHLLDFLGVDKRFVAQPRAVPSHPHVLRAAGISRVANAQGVKRMAATLLPKGVKSLVKKVLYREGPLPELQREDRVRLVDYYREDVIELQDLIGRDLSSWLR